MQNQGNIIGQQVRTVQEGKKKHNLQYNQEILPAQISGNWKMDR